MPAKYITDAVPRLFFKERAIPYATPLFRAVLKKIPDRVIRFFSGSFLGT
jgi:hypothetical protein